MRIVCNQCGIILLLLLILLTASACFQNANVKQNTGLQLAPATTATSEVTAIAELNTPEAIPVLNNSATPELIQETTLGAQATSVTQLSAAQIEATNIVIQATKDAEPEQLEATPTSTPETVIEEDVSSADESLIQVFEPEDETIDLSENSCIHIVQNGDTLYSIAQTYNTTVTTLVTLNSIPNSDVISVGQQIYVPNCGTQLIENQDDPTGASALAVEVEEIIHVIQEGEGLFDIALRYGVTVTSIAQANNIQDINTVYLGQELIIPSAE